MRLVGVIISVVTLTCSLSLAAPADDSEPNCAFPIQNYWTEVQSTPVWDLIFADYPEIAGWRSYLTSVFRVWSLENGKFRSVYTSSVRRNGHTLTIRIPVKSNEPARVSLRIDSDPYPKIWGENGETDLLNQPYLDFHNLFQESYYETLIVEGRPLKPEHRVSNLSHDEMHFVLRASIHVPVDTQHLHLLMMITERVRRSNLVH